VASVAKTSGVFALGTFAKWAVLATAVTAAGVAGNVVMSRPVASSATRAPLAPVSMPATAAPKPPEQPTEIAPIEPVATAAQPVEPAPPAVARVVPTSTSKTATKAAPIEDAPLDAERLAEEVALVDQARGALARGDAGAALRALDEYEARFSERRFAPEALYLRMESLLRLGKSETARAVAERLAKRFPSSPHTARARQVLTQTNP
jgi:TolA-binding protein